jgi:hypothetical protein
MFSECSRIHGVIADRLNLKQYDRWTSGCGRNYLARFKSVKDITKSKKLLSLAEQGIQAYHIEIRKTFRLVG